MFYVRAQYNVSIVVITLGRFSLCLFEFDNAKRSYVEMPFAENRGPLNWIGPVGQTCSVI